MKNISVVIATIGEPSLNETIKCLLDCSYNPQEIIVCVPSGMLDNLSQYVVANCKIVESPLRGQVNQRCVGFGHVSPEADLVLQLDSDMSLNPTTIADMVADMDKLPELSALGIKIRDGSRESDFMFKISRWRWVNKWFHYLVNGKDGFAPGGVALTGINFPFIGLTAITSVDWLPGGCIMHRRSNLICENFFPFEGKAYCEDLFHSAALQDRGISLYYSPKITCQTKMFNQLSLLAGLKSVLNQLPIHYRFANREGNVCKFRFGLIYFLFFVSRIL